MRGLGWWGRICMQVIKGRWMVVVASFYIKAFSGANLVFGIYSNIPIKASLNYDQSTIDTLGFFFKDLGANVGIFAGLMSEVMHPWVVLTIGAALNFSGYFMIWLAVSKIIPPPPLWQMYLFMCIGADSPAFPHTPVTVTCLENFPHFRGILLGFVKGFAGLSGAIFSQLYYSLNYVNGNNSQDVLLLVAWLPALINLLFMFFIRTIKPHGDSSMEDASIENYKSHRDLRMEDASIENYKSHRDLSMEDARVENKQWFLFLYIGLTLAAFLMLVIILENQLQIAMSSSLHKLIAATTLLLVVSNILVAIKGEREEMKKLERDMTSHAREEMKAEDMVLISVLEKGIVDQIRLKGSPKVDDGSEEMNSSAKAKKALMKKFKVACAIKGSKRGDTFTIPQALLSWDMWILFTASTCGLGAGLAAIDNMGQIGESLGYTEEGISTMVSLINIWSFLGRLLAGFASEALSLKKKKKKKGIPRPVFLTIFLLMECAGHLLIAFPLMKGSLYVASVVIGLSFGGQWLLLSDMISEIFGLKYFATLFNVLGSLAVMPLGSYLFSVKAAGLLYHRQAALQGAVGLSCLGPQCVATAFFMIMASVCLFGSLVCGALLPSTNIQCNQLLYSMIYSISVSSVCTRERIKAPFTLGGSQCTLFLLPSGWKH